MNKNTRIIFFTKYDQAGASSRYRTYQYLPYIEGDVEIDVKPLLSSSYLEKRFKGGRTSQISLLLTAFIKRFFSVLLSKPNSLLVIEYELIPYFPALLERWLYWRKIPYIVDYDDALFHQYDHHKRSIIRWGLGNKVATVMRLSKHVTAGNMYLANYAKSAGSKAVSIIPTVVDLERYKNFPSRRGSGVFTIVWIGSPSTTPFLYEILPALQEVSKSHQVRLCLIGADEVDFPGVDVEIKMWEQEKEVEYIGECDVGIMPLPDTPWTRGKCGFKLIQYMACGLPIIASPVGVNADIVKHGENGYLANTQDQWIEAILNICHSSDLAAELGNQGRLDVESTYCLQVTSKQYREVLFAEL